MAQKSIITITDTEPGKIEVTIEFDPPVKPTSESTSGINAALEMVTLITKKSTE